LSHSVENQCGLDDEDEEIDVDAPQPKPKVSLNIHCEFYLMFCFLSGQSPESNK
jgi:hypothetical protein